VLLRIAGERIAFPGADLLAVSAFLEELGIDARPSDPLLDPRARSFRETFRAAVDGVTGSTAPTVAAAVRSALLTRDAPDASVRLVLRALYFVIGRGLLTDVAVLEYLPFGAPLHRDAALAVVHRFVRAYPALFTGAIAARVIAAARDAPDRVACIFATAAARGVQPALVDLVLGAEGVATLPPFLRLLKHWLVHFPEFAARKPAALRVFLAAIRSGQPEAVRAGYLAAAGVAEVRDANPELIVEHLASLDCKDVVVNFVLTFEVWPSAERLVPALVSLAKQVPLVPYLLCNACENPQNLKIVGRIFEQVVEALPPSGAFVVFLRLCAVKETREAAMASPVLLRLFTGVAKAGKSEDVKALHVIIQKKMEGGVELLQRCVESGFLSAYIDATIQASDWALVEVGLLTL
jgi:hypothetical protein